MADQYAGFWGPEALTDDSGNGYANATFHVYLRGTTTPAVLYTDENKTATISGLARKSDALGNAWFWADKGEYDLNYGSYTLPITVGIAYLELVDMLSTVKTLADAGGIAVTGTQDLNGRSITNFGPVIETVTGTGYTLSQADNGKLKRFTSNSAITVTIPNVLLVNWNVGIRVAGTGQLTLVPATGVTLNTFQNLRKSAGQAADIGLICVGQNTGNTAPVIDGSGLFVA